VIHRVPDDLAERIGSPSERERKALDALALEEFKRGRLHAPLVKNVRASRAPLRQAQGSHLSMTSWEWSYSAIVFLFTEWVPFPRMRAHSLAHARRA